MLITIDTGGTYLTSSPGLKVARQGQDLNCYELLFLNHVFPQTNYINTSTTMGISLRSTVSFCILMETFDSNPYIWNN